MASPNSPVEITYLVRGIFKWKKKTFVCTESTPTFDSLKTACLNYEEFELKRSRLRMSDIAICRIVKSKPTKISC